MTTKKKAVAKKRTTKKKAQRSVTKAGTSSMSKAQRVRLFVEALIANGGNKTEAAKSAGYSEKSAAKQGSRLSQDVEVKRLLAERQDKLAKKFELTAENVIAELAKIVYADPRKLYDEDGHLLPIQDWPDEMAGAVASIESDHLFEGTGKNRYNIGVTKKLKLWDKNSARRKP